MRVRFLSSVMVAVSALAACSGADDPGGEVTIDGVVVEADQSRAHTDSPDVPVEYEASPPSGGMHAPIWLNCGVYRQPVPDRFAVHALEHGVVWFAHEPDMVEDDVAALVRLYETEPGRVVVSPYPLITSPVVAVAWERRLAVEDPRDPRLAEFLDAFVDGSQSPEPGAPCEGGVG